MKKREKINKKFFKKFFLTETICFLIKKDPSISHEKTDYLHLNTVSGFLFSLSILRSSRF